MAIRFGVIKSVSIANECAFDPDCAARGYGMDAALMVCHHLNLRCSFEWFNDKDGYGDFNESSGVGTGLIGAIYRGEIDTSIPILTPTYSRFKAVDFSNLYFFADVVTVTRAPKDGHFLRTINWNFIDAFQWPVWIAILASLIITCLFVSYAQGGLDHHMHRKKLLNFFETALSLLTRQYGNIETHPSSAVFAVTLWATVFIVLTSAYTGELFSQKMSPIVKPPFKNLEEFTICVEKDICRIIASSRSASYLQLLLVPGTGTGDRLNRALAKRPFEIEKNKTRIAEKILEEREKYLVWVTSEYDFSYYLTDHKDQACSYYVVQMPHDDNCAFALRKNETKLLRKFNMMADSFREAGLQDKVNSKYFTSSMSCYESQDEIYVEFWEIIIIMYFYVAGMIVGGIGLLCEFLYTRHGKEIL